MSSSVETSSRPLQVPVPVSHPQEGVEPLHSLASHEIPEEVRHHTSPVIALQSCAQLASPQEVSSQPPFLQSQQQLSISNLEEAVASGSPTQCLQIQMPLNVPSNTTGLPPSPLSSGVTTTMGYPAPPATHMLAAPTIQAPIPSPQSLPLMTPLPSSLSSSTQGSLTLTSTAPSVVSMPSTLTSSVSSVNHSSDGSNKPTPGTDEWLKQRRESHKEVERRRREVINTGINELAKIVPNCVDRNKGGILHRAVQYIQQLKDAEQRNAERWTLDKMLADQAINDLTGYVEYFKSEIEALRNQITQLGGEAPPRAQPPAPSVPPYHAHAMAAAMHPGYHYFAPPPGHWAQAPYPHPGHLALPQHPAPLTVLSTPTRAVEKYEDETTGSSASSVAVAAVSQNSSMSVTPTSSAVSTPIIPIHHASTSSSVTSSSSSSSLSTSHPHHPQEDTTNLESLHPQEEPTNLVMHAMDLHTLHVHELTYLASAPSTTTALPSVVQRR
ncbi:basic helix-loop-helix protein [Coelomomyces lativittatus]|nr:basic helix-loop-helix protein [Coelomomyces lativittatus]